MDWPRTPVERLRRFAPSFCPWPECTDHRRDDGGYRYRKKGFYTTKRHERRRRFRCAACHRTFSERTFSPRYFLKRPRLLIPVAAGLVAGSAHAQIARTVECAPSTVTRLSARIGRHALLLQARALERLRGRLDEPVCFDHFETFEYAKDYQFGIATPVGSESWFVFGADPAPHARTGRRTPAQERRRRGRPRRPRRGGYTGSTTRMLDGLLPLVRPGESLHLIADGKPQYRQAVSNHSDSRRIELVQYVNPCRGSKGSARSHEARARDHSMFPVDSWHALIQHSCAAHKPRTIAFGRWLNALLERMFLTTIWRNFVKRRSERKPDPTTPAMQVGLTETRWNWKRVFSVRLFPGREDLPTAWQTIYDRDWTSPVLPSNTRHRLKFAY